MSNALGEDITGRYVVLEKETFSPQYQDIQFRVFHATGGFGCSPTTAGTAVIGETPIDGEKFRIDGHDIERFATDEEIALVTQKQES